MTNIQPSDRDVDRALRSWLHEDRHEDASRLAGTVLNQVDITPQRRAGWLAWRTSIMNKFVPIGLAAAAVVAVAFFFGSQLLASPSDAGGPGVEADQTADPETVVREWIAAVNRSDAAGIRSALADRVTTADAPNVDADDVAQRVTDLWCPMMVDSIERVGDAFLVSATFRDDADGSCVEGAPGTSGTFTVEVTDGLITRLP